MPMQLMLKRAGSFRAFISGIYFAAASHSLWLQAHKCSCALVITNSENLNP